MRVWEDVDLRAALARCHSQTPATVKDFKASPCCPLSVMVVDPAGEDVVGTSATENLCEQQPASTHQQDSLLVQHQLQVSGGHGHPAASLVHLLKRQKRPSATSTIAMLMSQGAHLVSSNRQGAGIRLMPESVPTAHRFHGDRIAPSSCDLCARSWLEAPRSRRIAPSSCETLTGLLLRPKKRQSPKILRLPFSPCGWTT